MKILSFINLKKIAGQIRAEGVSMQKRFVVYIISAITLAISLIFLLLNLFGILNPSNARIMDMLDTQLLSYSDNITNDYDSIAAYAISLSGQLETEIQNYLTENGLSFEDLKNNSEALFSLQNRLYGTVYLHMQLAQSSGAFYILDSTVNSRSPEPLYNGIYLKYINIFSESTVNNSITIYRGSYDTGKTNGLTFHSGWQNEMKTDFFDGCESAFSENNHYILSPTVEIPETWERSRYVYVPIRDIRENIIGICGFEVNDLYFRLSEKSIDGEFGPMIGALLDEDSGICSGQFDTNRYSTDEINVYEKNGFRIFDFGTEKCIGRTKNVKLGSDTFCVALMMPEVQFDGYVNRGQLKTAGIILFVLVIAFAYCQFISRKYLSPLLKKIAQIKSNESSETQLRIREIDDLFDFLAERDTETEERFRELESEKKIFEAEAERTKKAYENALKKYELARDELSRLSGEQRKEIVIEDYEFFISNLRTLTPTEYRVYELYLEGKTAAEIARIMGITENTMKYHNKNIYSKLGISSRKQLLQFASLKQHRDLKSSD